MSDLVMNCLIGLGMVFLTGFVGAFLALTAGVGVVIYRFIRDGEKWRS